MKTILGIFLSVFSFSALSQQQKLYIEPRQSGVVLSVPITLGAINPAQNLVAVASSDRVVKIIDAQTLKERISLQGVSARVTSLLFGGDGASILTGLADGRVVLWNTTSGSAAKAFALHSSSVVGIGIEGGSSLFSVGYDRVVRFTDLNSGVSLGSLAPASEELTALALAPNGKSFALATATGVVRLYNMTQLLSPRILALGTDRITKIIFDPTAKTLFAATSTGALYSVDVGTMAVKTTVTAHKGAITSLATDPKGRWVVSASEDKTVRIFDLTTLVPLAELDSGGAAAAFAYFLTHELIYVGNGKGELKSWKVLEIPPDEIPPVVTILTPRQMADNSAPRWYGEEIQLEALVGDENKITEVEVNGTAVAFQDATEKERGSAPQATHVVRLVAQVPLPKQGLNPIEVKAVDQAGNVARQVIQVQRLSRNEALEIISPESNSETEKFSVLLQIRTWVEVTGYSISVNLVDMAEGQGIHRPRGSIISEEVSLMAGYNQIQVNVTAVNGEKFSKTLGVTRKVGAMAPTAASPGTKPSTKERSVGPQRWAVVVGVSAYQNSGIPSLAFADRDARAFADFLRTESGGGFDDDHLRVLINQDATIANIRDALINFLSQAIDIDLVIIYFAGHGAPEPARPNNLYLLAHDTDPNLLGTTAFPMWQIQDVLARYITAKRIVVFSDACHSGGISVNYATRGLAVTESNLINQYLSDLSRSKEGVVVFTASAAGEVSQEFPDLGHGVFTYYLLEGLKGAADFNNDYTVTVNEVMQYVEEQVKRRTRGAQNPTRSQTTYDKDLTLSVLPH
jgi:hypothetical protein